MKKYKLLKDLPFLKAGAKFKNNGWELVSTEISGMSIPVEIIENFDDWFEEIKEPEAYYYLSEAGAVIESEWSSGTHYAHVLTGEEFIENLKSIGNYFKTREQAEKHREWLKARAVLLEDCGGARDAGKWNVTFDEVDGFDAERQIYYSTEINFWTADEARASIKNHGKEWKIYFGVEE